MASRKAAAGTDHITVACKLPQGLHIHLPDRRQIKLHGSASPYAIAGHGMTRGIKASDWAEVEALYVDAAWLRSEAVFAMRQEEDASAKATERKEENVGFNPIDPRNPSASGVSIRIEAA